MSSEQKGIAVPAVEELLAPALLTAEHDLSVFHCSRASINAFLVERALNNHLRRISTVYVTSDREGVVWGYYALSMQKIGRKEAFSRKDRGDTPTEISLIALGKLGVDERLEGNNLGEDLLRDAFERVLDLTSNGDPARRLPSPAMLIQAADEGLIEYYRRFNFLARNAEAPLMLTRPIQELENDRVAAKALEAVDEIVALKGARPVVNGD
ncbi:hypothetical protein [Alloyangia pacifica]|uniref:Uncharacterized protein n=1 Tax=Alloyangia pacifica TaxID=311180 RepID=A0A1I6SEC9_9RHOB|nr:hypothetical protein [Alloyangia pacifica]SDG77208.1 hypothetical protein SAMN04488245_104310 [Alloyangia pacifica]SFS75309.1 hypothetical protein SAMN04488050_104310 [Alloyangia pacifica]